LSWRIHLLARLEHIPVIGYQLRPVNKPRSIARLVLETLWSGLPVWRFSPVMGLKSDGNRQDRYSRYLPLPVYQSTPGVARKTGPDGPLRILCVAKIAQPRKRHLLLLDALERLKDDTDFRLTLIGADTQQVSGFSDQYLEKLMDRLLNGPLKSNITLLTNVPPNQMAEHYLNHHICVLPADREPLGISPLEAMAFGTVPLTSTGTGSSGTIEMAGDDMVFQAGDVDDLYARLAAFASDRQQLETLGRQVREFAQENLEPKRFAEDLLRFITDLKNR
jgi:glycosyltransferase involved in cell wall biosynthesis